MLNVRESREMLQAVAQDLWKAGAVEMDSIWVRKAAMLVQEAAKILVEVEKKEEAKGKMAPAKGGR